MTLQVPQCWKLYEMLCCSTFFIVKDPTTIGCKTSYIVKLMLHTYKLFIVDVIYPYLGSAIFIFLKFAAVIVTI